MRYRGKVALPPAISKNKQYEAATVLLCYRNMGNLKLESFLNETKLEEKCDSYIMQRQPWHF